jgi:D-xylose transport system ATP-binding protein
MTETPILEVTNAVKSFGAINALDGVSLTVRPNEILALLGDNGAGKSTLIKAISGVHRLDAGQIRIDGTPMSFRSPLDARRAGVETVYQDLALFDNLDPVANFFLGREKTSPRWLGRLGMTRDGAMGREWQQAAERLGVRIKDVSEPVAQMSGGQRQAIAVAKAVAFARRIVILDEPTAALGLRESGHVLELIERLPAQGISVILISHNMEQVMRVAHRAVVIRQGRKVGEAVPSPENHHRIVSYIVGAEVPTEPHVEAEGVPLHS